MSKHPSVSESIDLDLDENRWAGVDLVRVALARRLAGAIDEVPSYAVPRLAGALRTLLDELDASERRNAAPNVEQMLRAVQ